MVDDLAAWQPVQINAGLKDDGFFVNSTGLQWSSDFGFEGWLGTLKLRRDHVTRD